MMSGGGNVKPPSDAPTAEETQTATAAAAALAVAHLALLHKETERVAKKQKVSAARSHDVIDEMLEQVRAARGRLAQTSGAEPGARRAVVGQLYTALNNADHTAQLASSSIPVKELHACVGKLGQAIDKVFTQACPTEARWTHPVDKTALRQAIAQHLFRQGRFELGDAYCASTADNVSRILSNVDVDVDVDGSRARGDSLAASSDDGDAALFHVPFREMHEVADEIEQRRNLEPLARWIESHREALVAVNDGGPIPLEFRMHKLQFMRALVGGRVGGGGSSSGSGGGDSGGRAVAVAYSQTHFPPFFQTHMPEIQRLMAATIYAEKGLEASPYADLLRDAAEGSSEESESLGVKVDPEGEVCDGRTDVVIGGSGRNGGSSLDSVCQLSAGQPISVGGDPKGVGGDWSGIALEFRRACCSLLGQSAEPPLEVVVNAGYLAMPTLIKLSRVLAAKGQKWNELAELPVEMELGRDYVFHSVFACPVARDQAAPDNPPMILPCGLVLCRGSIQKMTRGNARTFKCPYCPVETNVASCRQVFF
mmetsp:Transcript_30733/g.77000  ORF Transcript_30733/g.77000 Transcript_30733/m.77000 type:complete len:539 (-) Transcript_30733:103-1719(-)